jgi:hypothetical protein
MTSRQTVLISERHVQLAEGQFTPGPPRFSGRKAALAFYVLHFLPTRSGRVRVDGRYRVTPIIA